MNNLDVVGAEYQSLHADNVKKILDGLLLASQKSGTKVVSKPGYMHLKFIASKDLTTWLPLNNTDNIKGLIEKIDHLIFGIGSPSSVTPMLKSILTGRIKVWRIGPDGWKRIKRREKKKNYDVKPWCDDRQASEAIYGHFRMGHTGYLLTAKELQLIKLYFNL